MADTEEFLNNKQINSAVKKLHAFEKRKGYAPTAVRLIEEIARADKSVKKIVEKGKGKEQALVKELVKKLGEREVYTDD